jgi:nucleotide-binding universal stress UspA family protein
MDRILVAVDDDEQAGKVVALAGTLARQCGATLTLCHVMPQERYRRIEREQLRDQVEVPFSMSQAEEQAREMALAFASVLQDLDVTFEGVGRIGDPAETIVSLAQEIDADLIAMGFEALQGLERLRALGSVSRAVMEHSHRPVLVVPAIRET